MDEKLSCLKEFQSSFSSFIYEQISFVKYFIFFHVLSKQDSTKSIVRTKIFYLDY